MNNKHLTFIIILMPIYLIGQCFLTGADLSYTNEILNEGGIYYNENGVEVDPFEYFADQGTKIVRLRLWHTPTNNIDFCGNPIDASSLEDVLNAATKVKLNGMQLKLSIHYSDYFVDPGKQKMPLAWEGLSHSVLLDSITNYTHYVLEKLHAQNTLPEIVSVGNETTWGFIDATTTTDGFNWSQDADKYNVALSAIDSFNQTHNSNIKKAIHLTESTALWATNLFMENGVENFDIIGISYYPNFSPAVSLSQVGEIINELYTDYGKEVMVFETGFAWSNNFADNYNNFIGNNGTTLAYPKTPQGQKDFLIDLAETILQNNGTGLIYWEPSWITSNLCDKWGQGSSYENVAMFDTENNQPLVSFDFFEFCEASSSTEIQSFPNIEIYPSPLFSEELKIQNAPNNSTWKLFDLSGKMILNGVFKNNTPINTINLSTYSKGVYFLSIHLESSEARMVKKLIIL